MKITTKYELGDKVKIKPFENTEDTIEGFSYSYNNLKYYTYFYTNELEKM